MKTSIDSIKFTEQEKRIYSHLTDNPNLILNNTSESLAKIMYSSPSALNRLAKKLGYRGYAELRINFAIDYKRPQDDKNNISDLDTLLNQKIPNLYESVLKKNAALLSANPSALKQLSASLNRATHIDIYATGVNYYLARAMSTKLTEAGYDTHVANYLDLDYLQSIKEDNHLAIILSRTGKNPTCLYAAEQNMMAGITTLSVSREGCLELSKKCSFSLAVWIPQDSHPQKNIIQTLSIGYLFDFIALAKGHEL